MSGEQRWLNDPNLDPLMRDLLEAGEAEVPNPADLAALKSGVAAAAGGVSLSAILKIALSLLVAGAAVVFVLTKQDLVGIPAAATEKGVEGPIEPSAPTAIPTAEEAAPLEDTPVDPPRIGSRQSAEGTPQRPNHQPRVEAPAPNERPVREQDPQHTPSELELLARAHDALSGNAVEALRFVEQHRTLFPRGELTQEREAVSYTHLTLPTKRIV